MRNHVELYLLITQNHLAAHFSRNFSIRRILPAHGCSIERVMAKGKKCPTLDQKFTPEAKVGSSIRCVGTPFTKLLRCRDEPETNTITRQLQLSGKRLRNKNFPDKIHNSYVGNPHAHHLPRHKRGEIEDVELLCASPAVHDDNRTRMKNLGLACRKVCFFFNVNYFFVSQVN